uniref:Putative secreted protein n=1 Tax=Amblyomma cajennense TaxID=34607 RepID=A0A023FB77_AMBCJ
MVFRFLSVILRIHCTCRTVLQAANPSRSILALVPPIFLTCSNPTKPSHVCCASPPANRKCCHSPVPLPCCTNSILAQ